MKTQISRWTDDPARRLSGVYQQQGRMITDADLNELMELVKRRLDEALGEVVGSGTPRGGGIGLVEDGPKLRRGTVYADGVRARLESTVAGTAPFELGQQADFPGAPAAPAAAHTLYADVWELATTALHDSAQLDPALHGADTATRTKNLVQVKWCAAATDPATDPANPQKGDATLQLEIRQGGSAPDPCDPCAEAIALDARIGNYLLRVEVHDVKGPANAPTGITLKWSSENGAEQHGQADAPTEFKRGDWIYEFYSDTTERHLGVNLASGFAPARAVLKDGWPAAADLPAAAQFPYVRRWDGYAVLEKTGSAWSIKEDDGALQAKDKGRLFVGLPAGTEPTHGHFELGSGLIAYLSGLKLTLALDTRKFVAGDFWLAAVREKEGGGTVQPAQGAPLGITHHYAVLAKVKGDGTRQPPSDADVRRLSFPRLTDIPADHVAYDPAPQAARWTDIIDTPPVPAPLNVQRAIDLLLERLDGSDLSYLLPTCPSTPSVRSLLGSVLVPPLVGGDGRIKLDELLKIFLCVFDAGTLPYQAGNATGDITVREWLNLIPTKVSKAGDTMSGALHVQGGGLHVGPGTTAPGDHNLKVDGNCVIDGNLTVNGDTTTVNASQLEVEDRIIRMNKYPPQATPQVVNGGVEVFRGGTAPNAQVIWDETDDRWKVGVEGSLLPIATGQAQDVVTGVVVFELLPFNQEMVSQMIDPGHGPGPICVQLGIDESFPVANQTTLGDPGFTRPLVYRAEVDRTTGHFRILARRTASGLSTARVRWWALKPRAGETVQTVVISVTISPPNPTVEVNRTIALVQTVIGTTNQNVTWQVTEGAAGGTITANGQYTAPGAPGTYHVIARSVADTSKTVTVAVVVTPAKLKDTKDTKEIKEKDIKDVSEKVLEKQPPDTKVKDLELATPPGMAIVLSEAPDGGGRSFIRPEERPDVGLPPA